jgi:deoxyribonuclease V
VLLIGGCFACFDAADKGWAAAVLTRNRRPVATALSSAPAGAPYEPGLLALREGALLEAAVRSLPRVPDVLLVNATGRDHPRRAGLALHLGAVLGLPTVGVTDRTLLASGSAPSQARGSFAPLCIGDEPVGAWVRTRTGTRPVAAHAAWRTDHDVAVAVVMIATRRARTPEPMRRARRAARTARAGKGFPA